jgi:hypothetical protein
MSKISKICFYQDFFSPEGKVLRVTSPLKNKAIGSLGQSCFSGLSRLSGLSGLFSLFGLSEFCDY